MNNGKQLEHVISLIEESLKDNHSTEIFKNHKLENTAGNEREFDVVIKSKINGYDLIIVIECKDYTAPVAVKEIEAFKAKCDRILGINKKIFVSRKGYQRDAIAAAKDFDIELLEADKLSSDEVFKWFPVRQLKLIRYREYKDVVIHCDLDEVAAAEMNKYTAPDKSIIHFDDGTSFLIHEVLDKEIEKNIENLWSLAISYWLKAKKEDRYNVVPVPFEINFKSFAKLDLDNGNTIIIGGISATNFIQLTEVAAIISDARQVVDSSGNVKAKSVQVDFGDHGKGDIVMSNGNTAIYAQGEDGSLHK